MSEKIAPIGFSFITNRYSRSDVVKKPLKSTVIVDNEKYNYDDIFERHHFEPDRLYSLENKGRVKGLFESKNGKDFISLTKTFDGGILEKVKNGESVTFARYSNNGVLTDLAEVVGDKITIIERSGKITDAVGTVGKIRLQNFIRGIKII